MVADKKNDIDLSSILKFFFGSEAPQPGKAFAKVILAFFIILINKNYLDKLSESSDWLPIEARSSAPILAFLIISFAFLLVRRIIMATKIDLDETKDSLSEENDQVETTTKDPIVQKSHNKRKWIAAVIPWALTIIFLILAFWSITRYIAMENRFIYIVQSPNGQETRLYLPDFEKLPPKLKERVDEWNKDTGLTNLTYSAILGSPEGFAIYNELQDNHSDLLVGVRRYFLWIFSLYVFCVGGCSAAMFSVIDEISDAIF